MMLNQIKFFVSLLIAGTIIAIYITVKEITPWLLSVDKDLHESKQNKIVSPFVPKSFNNGNKPTVKQRFIINNNQQLKSDRRELEKKNVFTSEKNKLKHFKLKTSDGVNLINDNQENKNIGTQFSNIYEEWVQTSHGHVSNHLAEPLQEATDAKQILVYTSLFNVPEWPHLKKNESQNYLKMHKCPVTNCKLSYDHQQISRSDAVVFHARDIVNVPDLVEINNMKKPENQMWIYFTSESPFSSFIDARFDSLFDWTMTYKYDSDIWLPYARYHMSELASEKSNIINYAKTKRKLMSWLVSHCDLMRDKIVHEIEQYLPVHVGGHCASHFEKSFTCINNEDCDSKISEYKFYLAFESQHCDGYVTEKYWYRAIRNNVVPIVLGAGPYDDPKVAIPGSYINILDFNSISDFIEYIKYLDGNDTAYNQYFKWKQTYTIWNPICDWPFEPYWACDICIRLNRGVEKHKSLRISEFWSIQKDCHGRMARLHHILEKSGNMPSNFETRRKQEERESFYDSYGKELEYVDEVGVTDQPDSTEIDSRSLQNSKDSQHMIILFLFIISAFGMMWYLSKVYNF